MKRGGGVPPGPPEDADHDGHHPELVEVIPALHENRVEARHDIFVVQPADGARHGRQGDEQNPEVMGEDDPFAAARTAQQEERHEGQRNAGPLVGVETLAEDHECPDEHHNGARGVDRPDDGDREVLHAEVTENPRSEHDGRFQNDQGVGLPCAGSRRQQGMVEPSEAELRREDRGQEEQRRKERVEQQHGQHGVAGEGLFLGRIVEAEQRRRGECQSEPHSDEERRPEPPLSI